MQNSTIGNFVKLESAGGIVLVIATVLALIVANSPLAGMRELLLAMPLEMRIGELEIAKPLLLWINDGLMAIFFLHVGLELKREFLEGELNEPAKIVMPAMAAIGGIVVPSGIYAMMNWNDPSAIGGWAIPAATDIAFALGVLGLLGKRVPLSLKIFLLSLAILDDIGAILIIAFFYSGSLSTTAFVVAGIAIAMLFGCNRMKVMNSSVYLFIGFILWWAVLKSGVHATLAGVVLAFFIPMRDPKNPEYSPAKELEHNLHHTVAFIILPIFAFANAGLPLMGLTLEQTLHPVPLGIMAGLLLGKPIGVFLFSWVSAKIGICELPKGVTWGQIFGASILCGIGFTMSLFIGSLAFEQGDIIYDFDERLGILIGSVLAAIGGYLVLNKVLPKMAADEPEQDKQH
ncbi:Na+/H+ antiporter NhaA [Echinimonas agarilytica]|uniref:Na(+)/H(+) antiporter NhaA n=1 Tax=Echinimonas agarilytica TaxID=1215918 RepID=A0AA41WA50_9GAMM|nr:Na+/H+ antiporter NhaA [Echinimonas agarilytica]MCM2680834.1 Na+/H+ antiporter NhaA [Echinimonas agarilytica]